MPRPPSADRSGSDADDRGPLQRASGRLPAVGAVLKLLDEQAGCARTWQLRWTAVLESFSTVMTPVPLDPAHARSAKSRAGRPIPRAMVSRRRAQGILRGMLGRGEDDVWRIFTCKLTDDSGPGGRLIRETLLRYGRRDVQRAWQAAAPVGSGLTEANQRAEGLCAI